MVFYTPQGAVGAPKVLPGTFPCTATKFIKIIFGKNFPKIKFRVKNRDLLFKDL
jgi:hypothetical protein